MENAKQKKRRQEKVREIEEEKEEAFKFFIVSAGTAVLFMLMLYGSMFPKPRNIAHIGIGEIIGLICSIPLIFLLVVDPIAQYLAFRDVCKNAEIDQEMVQLFNFGEEEVQSVEYYRQLADMQYELRNSRGKYQFSYIPDEKRFAGLWQGDEHRRSDDYYIEIYGLERVLKFICDVKEQSPKDIALATVYEFDNDLSHAYIIQKKEKCNHDLYIVETNGNNIQESTFNTLQEATEYLNSVYEKLKEEKREKICAQNSKK